MEPELDEKQKLAIMEQEINISKNMSRIKHKLAVISGKGGVGKSTVSVNIAAELSKRGYTAGILDADIHGPSVPKMLGVNGSMLEVDEDKLIPVKSDSGINVMSIGFLLPSEDSPIIWRGPKKAGAIKQFLSDVKWSDLDVLIIDNPPGTGDEPLTVLQSIPSIDGVVVVTTPQSVAIDDVEKSINMAKSMKIKVLGVIENMSGFVCPHCGEETPIFGKGGGEKMAKSMGVPFLGRLPIDPKTPTASDEGKPIMIKDPESPLATKFSKIIDKIESEIN